MNLNINFNCMAIHKAILLLAAISLSSFCNASVGEWKLLKSEELNVNKSVVILVSGVAVSADFKLVTRSGTSEIVTTPQERGVGAIFFLEASTSSRTFEIYFRNHFDLALPLSATVRQIPLAQSANHLAYYRSVSDSLKHWVLATDQDWKKALEQMKFAIGGLSKASPIYSEVMRTYLWMLVSLERYDEAYDIAHNYIEEFYKVTQDNSGSFDFIEVMWLEAIIVDAIKGASSSASYEAVYALLEKEESLPLFWRLNKIEILGTIGRQEVILGYRSLRYSHAEKGKSKLEEALELASRVGDLRLTARIQNLLSIYFWLKKDYLKGEQLLKESILNHRAVGVSRELVDSLNNLAYSIGWLGRTDEAREALTQALSIEETFPSHSEKGSLSLNLAKIYLTVGKNELALIHSKAAMQKYEEVERPLSAARAQLTVGTAYRALGDHWLAIANHKASLEVFLEQNDRYLNRVSDAREELIRNYIALDQLDIASDYAKTLSSSFLVEEKSTSEALSRSTPALVNAKLMLVELAVAKNNQLDFTILKSQLVELFEDVGQGTSMPVERLELAKHTIAFYLKNQMYTKVEETSSEVLALIASVRKTLDVTHLGPAWSNQVSEVLDLCVLSLWKIAKSSDSADSWNNLFKFLTGNSSVNLRLNRSISALNPNEGSFESQKHISAIAKVGVEEHKTTSAKTVHERTLARIRASEARERLHTYSELEDAVLVTSGVGIKTLQDRLKPGEIAIQTYVRNKVSLAFVVKKDEWWCLELLTADQLDWNVKDALGEVNSRKSQLNVGKLQLQKFLPLERHHIASASKLIIVLDGPLLSLPISVLNISQDKSYKALAERFEVTISYSLQDYVAKEQSLRQLDHLADMGIFYDPLFQGADSVTNTEFEEVPSDGHRAWSKSLYRLPWTAKEAESIQGVFSEKNIVLLSREKATTKNLLSPVMRHSKVLHIASHGYFSSSNQDVIGIATTPDFESENPTGFLTLTHLLSEQFSSNLVVVSGCETSLGENLNGEGLNGLSRGLLAKGAGSVIGTLWSIPDKPTALFMKEFYLNLKASGGNSARALAFTKRSFISNARYKNPYYWASFVLTSANREYEANVFR